MLSSVNSERTRDNFNSPQIGRGPILQPERDVPRGVSPGEDEGYPEGDGARISNCEGRSCQGCRDEQEHQQVDRPQ